MKSVTYISELCLPSNSGYAQHVLKVCDTFSKKFDTNLFVISNDKSFLKYKSDYLLKRKLAMFVNKLDKELILCIYWIYVTYCFL